MSVYFMANIKIHDQAIYDKYLETCDEVFAKYNGKYLAVDNEPTILEGDWDYTKSVLIEFDDETSFYNWYTSDDYQEIIQYRLGGALCNTILIHGS